MNALNRAPSLFAIELCETLTRSVAAAVLEIRAGWENCLRELGRWSSAWSQTHADVRLPDVHTGHTLNRPRQA